MSYSVDARRSVLDLLCTRFPKTFFAYQVRRRPLKVEICCDLEAVLGDSVERKLLGRALAYYTLNFGYLRASQVGADEDRPRRQSCWVGHRRRGAPRQRGDGQDQGRAAEAQERRGGQEAEAQCQPGGSEGLVSQSPASGGGGWGVTRATLPRPEFLEKSDQVGRGC